MDYLFYQTYFPPLIISHVTILVIIIKSEGDNMKLIQNFDEFNTIIHSNDFVLIYVSSENCSVCIADHPIVQDIVNEYNIPAYEIVANNVPEAVGQLNLFTSPVVMLFYNKKEIHRQARILDFNELRYRIEQVVG